MLLIKTIATTKLRNKLSVQAENEGCPCKHEGLKWKCSERRGGWSRAEMHMHIARKGLTHTEETPLTHSETTAENLLDTKKED